MFGKPHETTKRQYTKRLSDLTGIGKLPRDTNASLFGIEIEAEGYTPKGTKVTLDQGWIISHDGSLRNGGVEFVLSSPKSFNECKELLKNLEAYSKEFKLDFSERTSVHVHFNAADWTAEDLHKFVSIYYLIENPFTLAAGGPERVGNRFCLRAIDANEVVDRIKSYLRNQHPDMFDIRGDRRYLALNYSSFSKFGSLEFRAHKGTNNANDLILYLEAISELREAKNKFKTAIEVIEEYSALSPLGFLLKYLPKTYEFMRSYLTEREILDQINESYYIAQELAYCVNIVEAKEEKIPPKFSPKKYIQDYLVIDDEPVTFRQGIVNVKLGRTTF